LNIHSPPARIPAPNHCDRKAGIVSPSLLVECDRRGKLDGANAIRCSASGSSSSAASATQTPGYRSVKTVPRPVCASRLRWVTDDDVRHVTSSTGPPRTQHRQLCAYRRRVHRGSQNINIAVCHVPKLTHSETGEGGSRRMIESRPSIFGTHDGDGML
jgi:hypothetical protein